MKRLLLLLSCSGALMCAAELSGVHSVYLMPMSHGFDQYLANRLAGEHLFLVVTDPTKADAVFSDRFGEAFQAQLDALLPAPPPEKPKAPEKPVDKGAKKTDEKADEGPGLFTETTNKLSNPALASSFGRAKGTVFLVDMTSRQVIWSIYQPPKNSTSRAMDRTASDIVSRLRKDWKDSTRTPTKKAARPKAAKPAAAPSAAPVAAPPKAPPATAPPAAAPAVPAKK